MAANTKTLPSQAKYVDKYNLKPKEIGIIDSSVELQDVLMVSSLRNGGVCILSEGKILLVDYQVTHGLWRENESLYRSIGHFDYLEVYRYDPDGSHTVITTLEACDIHDVRMFQGNLYAVSTGSNEVVCLSPDGEVLNKWTYLGDGDAWHLNCLDDWNGRLVISCFGKFETHRAWKGHTDGAGIVFDVHTGEIVWKGLNQPHNPRIDENGYKYVCNSATKQLLVDKGDGKIHAVDLPGFTRGIAFGKNHIYVGISQQRRKDPTVGQDQDGLVCIIDRKDLKLLGLVKVPFVEIYDLLIVPS